jgi:hypothetical protein
MVLLGFPWSLLPIPSPWRSDHGITVFVTGFCLLNWMIVSILLMRSSVMGTYGGRTSAQTKPSRSDPGRRAAPAPNRLGAGPVD